MDTLGAGISGPAKEATTKPWFAASMAITLFLAGLLVWYIAFSFHFVSSFKNRELAVERATWKLLLRAEAMYAAARISALSGNLKWREAYSEIQPELERLLTQVSEMGGSRKIQRVAERMRSAYAELKGLGEEAFRHVSRGDKEKAQRLLAGWSYIKNRMQLEDQAKELVALVQESIARKTTLQGRRVTSILTVIGACLAALVLSWAMTIRFWHRNMRMKSLAEKALRESEDKYKSLIQTSPDAITLADSTGRLHTFNPAMAERFSRTNADLQGKSYGCLMDEEAAARCLGYGRKAIAENTIIFQEDIRGDRSYEEYYIPVRTSSGESLFQVISKDVTDRKEMEQRLIRMSLYDASTGLYSRFFFQEEMKRLASGRHSPLGLVVCDINGLKFVNDTLGHQKGDLLLGTAAELLKGSFRDSDIVARIGGDEFAVLLPQSAEEVVASCCRRIRRELDKYNQQFPELGLSMSIGYAVENGPAPDMDALFKRADDAMYKEKLLQCHSSRNEMIQALKKTLEARDHITEGHSLRMTELTRQLGRSVGLSEERLNDLDLLTRFHDLGKVAVSDRVLFKPGPLTEQEYAEMKCHCEVGYRIAVSLTDLVPIAEHILKHHEHWDGNGYPIGLAGEEIPLECRILAIVDAYDAMTGERPYKGALSSQEALQELRRCAGTQFDPDLVERFIRICSGFSL
jgi:diguanylate cyclase (GGDEF)-like protein/PAS domain S-box-containing protein